MNKKKANSKLLKGAQRTKNLEVEVKSGCVNLRFDDGSYYEVILPLIKDWHSKVNETISVNEQEVQIAEIKTGFESTLKHVDTKLVVMSAR